MLTTSERGWEQVYLEGRQTEALQWKGRKVNPGHTRLRLRRRREGDGALTWPVSPGRRFAPVVYTSWRVTLGLTEGMRRGTSLIMMVIVTFFLSFLFSFFFHWRRQFWGKQKKGKRSARCVAPPESLEDFLKSRISVPPPNASLLVLLVKCLELNARN